MTTVEMPEMLTQAEVCSLLGISRSTLHRWDSEFPNFPEPRKIGRLVRYDAAEIRAWLLAQPRRTTS